MVDVFYSPQNLVEIKYEQFLGSANNGFFNGKGTMLDLSALW